MYDPGGLGRVFVSFMVPELTARSPLTRTHRTRRFQFFQVLLQNLLSNDNLRRLHALVNRVLRGGGGQLLLWNTPSSAAAVSVMAHQIRSCRS